MRERVCRASARLLDEDPRAAIVLSDISTHNFDRALIEHPHRCVNVGIMEPTMIGVAAGFAMEGFHPITHTIAPFQVERPLEQLKDDFGYQGLGGTFVSIGASYDYASDGATHHAPADVALLQTIPGFEILVPGTAEEAERLLLATYANGRPTYLRTTVAHNARSLEVEPGRIQAVRRGSRASVIAFGPMLDRTLRACEGLDVTVLYATSVSPFDADTVRRETAGEIAIAVEPFQEGTSASHLARALQDRPVRLGFIGVPGSFLTTYGEPEEHDRASGLDAEGIRARILSFIG